MFRFWRKTQVDPRFRVPYGLDCGHGTFTAERRYYRPQWEMCQAYWQTASELLRPGKHGQILLPLPVSLTEPGDNPGHYHTSINYVLLCDEVLPVSLWQLPSLHPVSPVEFSLVQQGQSWRATATQQFRWRVADIPRHLAQQVARVNHYGAQVGQSDVEEIAWYRAYRQRIDADYPPALSPEAQARHLEAQERLTARLAQKCQQFQFTIPWEVPLWVPKS